MKILINIVVQKVFMGSFDSSNKLMSLFSPFHRFLGCRNVISPSVYGFPQTTKVSYLIDFCWRDMLECFWMIGSCSVFSDQCTPRVVFAWFSFSLTKKKLNTYLYSVFLRSKWLSGHSGLISQQAGGQFLLILAKDFLTVWVYTTCQHYTILCNF